MKYFVAAKAASGYRLFAKRELFQRKSLDAFRAYVRQCLAADDKSLFTSNLNKEPEACDRRIQYTLGRDLHANFKNVDDLYFAVNFEHEGYGYDRARRVTIPVGVHIAYEEDSVVLTQWGLKHSIHEIYTQWAETKQLFRQGPENFSKKKFFAKHFVTFQEHAKACWKHDDCLEHGDTVGRACFAEQVKSARKRGVRYKTGNRPPEPELPRGEASRDRDEYADRMLYGASAQDPARSWIQRCNMCGITEVALTAFVGGNLCAACVSRTP